jgi:hypothetical protein
MTISEDLERRARRGYELGRFGWALRYAAGAVLVAALGLLGCAAPGLPIVLGGLLFAVLVGFLYRGEALGRGARVGWLAGLIPCWTPAAIRLTQGHCDMLCAHLGAVCLAAGLLAGGVLAFRSRAEHQDRRFLMAAAGVAVLVGAVGCVTAGLAAAVGMAIALCACTAAPLVTARG